MSSVLEQLQQDIAARLESLAYFADIPVFVLREETIQTKLDKALAGLTRKANKAGAAVSVLMPLVDVPRENPPGPQLEISVAVRVQELPLINFGASGTQKSAEDIALKVLAALHHFHLEGVCQVLTAAKDAITPSREFLPKLTYDVTVRASLPQEEPPRVLLPEISEAAMQVTLTPITPGSAIYYTLDGSFPWSGNSNAVLYSTPFTVQSGAQVRWAAYKAGMHGSDVGHAIITS
jgi:hypothetical protein